MQCHTGNCPSGVATQKAWRQAGLVVERKGPRVARFQHQTLHSLREIVVAMGLQSPWEIEPQDMRERLNGARSNAINAIYSFVEERQLIEGGVNAQLAAHWKAASAESFRRVS